MEPMDDTDSTSDFRRTSSGRVMRRLKPEDKPYVCEECGTRFVTQGNLNQHRIIHTGVKPFICSFCPARFFQKGNLKTHVRRIHKQPFTIPHTTTLSHPHHSSAYIAASIQSSGISPPINAKKPTQHQQCMTASSTHGTNQSNPSTISLSHHHHQPSGSNSPNKEYECEQCDAVFNRSIHLYWHKQKHQSGGVINQRYQCSKCPASFDRKYNFKIHMRTHTGEKPYRCDECGATFSQPNVLKSHMLIHTDNKEFKCSYCTASFSKPFFLKSHMLVHREASNYPLQLQPVTVAHINRIQSHSASSQPPPPPPLVKLPRPAETSVSPIEISDSGSSSSQFDNSEKQPSRKPLGTRERKFRCTFCVANFTVRRMLELHMHESHGMMPHQVETTPSTMYSNSRSTTITLPNEITYTNPSQHSSIRPSASASASTSSDYLTHQPGENHSIRPKHQTASSLRWNQLKATKSHKCCYCYMRFSAGHHLRMHMLTHTGEKPFKCAMCSSRFTQSGSLYRHQRNTGHYGSCSSPLTFTDHDSSDASPQLVHSPPQSTAAAAIVRKQPLQPTILPFQPAFLIPGVLPAQPVAMVTPVAHDLPIDLSTKKSDITRNTRQANSSLSTKLEPAELSASLAPAATNGEAQETPCDLTVSKTSTAVSTEQHQVIKYISVGTQTLEKYRSCNCQTSVIPHTELRISLPRMSVDNACKSGIISSHDMGTSDSMGSVDEQSGRQLQVSPSVSDDLEEIDHVRSSHSRTRTSLHIPATQLSQPNQSKPASTFTSTKASSNKRRVENIEDHIAKILKGYKTCDNTNYSSSSSRRSLSTS